MNELFSILSKIWVISGMLSAAVVYLHIRMGHPQKMKIMTAVWMLTALWSGIIGLILYFKIGVSKMDNMSHSMKMDGMDMSKMPMSGGLEMGSMNMSTMKMPERPFWQKVTLSTLHCGAGCTIADIIGEWLVFFFPFIILGTSITGQWILDYILALVFGIYFQYVVIKPMMNLTPKQAIFRALKIDFLSLSSWQVGMYVWMGIAIFGIYEGNLPKKTFDFWFMMQLAMMAGFVTAYPTNWLLIKKGIKKGM